MPIGPEISIIGDLPKPPRKRNKKRNRPSRRRPPAKVNPRRDPGPPTIDSATCTAPACPQPTALVVKGRRVCIACVDRLEKRAAELKAGANPNLTPPTPNPQGNE